MAMEQKALSLRKGFKLRVENATKNVNDQILDMHFQIGLTSEHVAEFHWLSSEGS